MAQPRTWSELLVAYAKKKRLLQVDVKEQIGARASKPVYGSQICGYFRGSKPRDEALLAIFEKWSDGFVKASAPARRVDLERRRKIASAAA